MVLTIPMTVISSPSVASVSTSTSCMRMPSFRSKLTTEDAVLSRAGFGGDWNVIVGADSDVATVDDPAPKLWTRRFEREGEGRKAGGIARREGEDLKLKCKMGYRMAVYIYLASCVREEVRERVCGVSVMFAVPEVRGCREIGINSLGACR